MLDNDQDAVVRKTRKSEYNAMARLEVAVGERRVSIRLIFKG